MPCYVSPEENAAYDALIHERWKKEGRWDLLATKEQLAGWLCDVMRTGHAEHVGPEAQRWFEAHKKFNDGETL